MSCHRSPMFTVVMTLFETQHFLPRAIACLMDQHLTDWELILVSDGPAKSGRFAPRPILRRLQRQFPENRIEYRELPRAEGTWGNVARAYGLRRARGNYICWVNHDNLISHDYLTSHAENISCRPGCLSVVDIHLWREERFIGRFPRSYRCGKIDLLCYSLPVLTAREIDAFGTPTERLYAADGKVFEAAAKRLTIQHTKKIVGVHF